MSIDRLSQQVEDIIDGGGSYDAIKARLKLDFKGWDGRFYEIEIHKNQVAQKLEDAVKEMVTKGIGNFKTYKKSFPDLFKPKAFQDAVDSVIDNFTKPSGEQYGKSGKLLGNADKNHFGRFKGVFRVKDTDKFFLDYSRNLLNTGGSFRKAFFKNWQLAAVKVMKIKYEDFGDQGTVGEKTPTAHDKDSTIFVDWLERRGNIANALIKLDVEQFDLAKEIVNALKIDFEEDTDLKGKGFKQTRVVRAHLGPDNISEDLDAKGKNRMLDALMNVKTGVLAKKWPYLQASGKAAAVEASVPFKKQVTQAASHRLVKSIVNSAKKQKIKARIVKGKIKKPKSTHRKGTLRKPKASSKPVKKKLTLAQKIAVAKAVQRKEKGTKEKTTKAARTLNQLRYDMDRGLTKEVQRNMGRPALINRTGRFANSVKLLSLTEAQNSIVAKYTYMMNPYATFENTGEKTWPLAYNPKRLIAKSIRNLAIGRIEDKLTLRRV